MTRKPSLAASKKRESEQRKERELFSWHSPFPLGGESERAIFAFVTLVCCKHTRDRETERQRDGETKRRRDKEKMASLRLPVSPSLRLSLNDSPGTTRRCASDLRPIRPAGGSRSGLWRARWLRANVGRRRRAPPRSGREDSGR